MAAALIGGAFFDQITEGVLQWRMTANDAVVLELPMGLLFKVAVKREPDERCSL